MNLKENIENAWQNRELLKDNTYQETVRAVIEEVDKGRLRVAEPINPSTAQGGWQVNEWVKQAILLYFGIQPMQTWDIAPFEFYDKMLLKKNYKELGVRAVPHAVARYGAYLAPGVVLMPSYTNIGAYVDAGTMVDTWATVGSCAQVGKRVHLSGGVGIGGVLEPPQATPVVVEDDAFIGSRAMVVEGARVRHGAKLGAGAIVTSSTRVFEAETGDELPRGEVPERAVAVGST